MSDFNRLTTESSETPYGELEVEDVSFLPGASGSTSKRSEYDPSPVDKCHRFVCSKPRSVVMVSMVVVFAIVIALIAAFARPSSNDCDLPSSPTSAPNQLATTPQVSTDGSPFPWASVRLPRSVFPLSYTLNLHPNLTTFLFDADVSIIVQVLQPTDFMVFHSRNLTISSYDLFVSDLAGRDLEQVKVVENLSTVAHEQVYIGFDQKLQDNKLYKLKMKYNGTISAVLSGFYRSSYRDPTNNTRWMASTQFEPTSARAALPCFDEPQFKANFTISIVREPQHTCLSNTDLERTDNFTAESSLLVDHFQTSVKMSTYLVAFIVSDFESVTNHTPTNNIRVSVYSPPTMLDQTALALDVAVKILDYYETEYFQIPYPLTKSDQVAVPDFPTGAMENWGLITYLLRALLYKQGSSSSSDQQWSVMVVAHELSHQWFGNLVTMEWWNDLWLNEGFANFMEYKGTDYVYPQWKMKEQFLVDSVVSGLHSDGLRSSHPISIPVDDPSEIDEIFDNISYQKGGSIIRMLEAFLGRETFERGIRRYLKAHMYGNAKTEDLWKSLSDQTQEDGQEVNVGDVMDTWTGQMGYPVVTVTREAGSFTAQQERFLFNPRSPEDDEFTSSFDYKWHIPLTFRTSDDPASQQRVWMSDTTASFPVSGKPDWMKFNANMTGFYRVNYDTHTWQELTTLLRTNHQALSSADRTSLLDDVFSLARSGHVNIIQALELCRYLMEETEYVPWKIALGALSYIGDLLEFTPAHQYYKEFMVSLIQPRLSEISWGEETDQLTVFLQTSLLKVALALDEESSVRKATQMFDRWKHGTELMADYKSVVYTAGVKHGGPDDWQYVWNQYVATTVPTEKAKLLHALTMTKDVHLLNSLLHRALHGSDIRQSELPRLVMYVASNPAGRILTWRFVKQNWNILSHKYSQAFSMARIISSSTSHFNTQFDYDEVKEFFEKKLTGQKMRAVSQSLERISMNKDWLTRNQEAASQWLQAYITS